MRIIEGFPSAKSALSRQPLADFYSVSPAVKQKLNEIFGAEINPELAVRQIISEVRRRGDAALFEYTARIDGVRLASLEVSREQIESAYRRADKALISALKLAAERISSFHRKQKSRILGKVNKTDLGELIRPLERVGVYVPGGTASYPSTVLMTVIPARVAGVKEIILTTPPAVNGVAPPPTLVAADIAGVDRIFSVGGAQAVAALAYGTETVPRVNKICGPGNVFVVMAKRLVYGVVDIDSLPGPSEVVVIADEAANPRYCALDLLAQAEHDPLASAILITTSRQLADEVNREIEEQLTSLPRKAIAAESLENKGLIAVVTNINEAIELANLYAPEHLCLMVDKADSYLDKVNNAGCVCIGRNSTVVLSDYVVGPSHVLPTGGTARFSSPLNITDFVKFINLATVAKADLKELAQAASVIARAERLEAHARAVEERLKADQ
ncbi:MAG: histidinol dehydrogenase [Dehalococcoidia bacterium]|nr:MAG: histidinol dehydrogenase [Dehalococcoidia bacterium]